MVPSKGLKMEMSMSVREHKMGTGIRVNEVSKEVQKITMATAVLKK